MGSMSIWHWLILLVVVLVIFGTKKLRNIGEDLGGAVRGFKEGVKDASAPPEGVDAARVADKSTIDVDAKEKSRV
jgi:sec-independent protein translocase protein TatA